MKIVRQYYIILPFLVAFSCVVDSLGFQSGSRQPNSKVFRRTCRLLAQASDDFTSAPSRKPQKPLSTSAKVKTTLQAVGLIAASLISSVIIIAWEETSTSHPMRAYVSSQGPFVSTVRGMAFGNQERQRVTPDIEPRELQAIPSYNEVMLKHRVSRVPTWTRPILKDDVKVSVRALQLALLQIEKCKGLAAQYEWEALSKSIKEPVLALQLDEACDILNRAKDFLPLETRTEIGFDFGSCAWRHCGAFADIREALDELDHLIGILEPFEAAFILDVCERSLRDMLAVTREYQDDSISIPDYVQLQRKSDMNEDVDGALDADYLAAMEFLKKFDE